MFPQNGIRMIARPVGSSTSRRSSVASSFVSKPVTNAGPTSRQTATCPRTTGPERFRWNEWRRERLRSSLFRRSHVPGTHSNRARRRRRRVVAAHRLRELLPKQDRVIVIDRERDHLNLHWLLVQPFLRKKDNAE